MKLLLVRHAIAEKRELFAEKKKGDFARPLTPRGRKKMIQNSAGLRRVSPSIDVIASSPLLRAKQTQSILLAEFPDAKAMTTELLAPAQPIEPIIQWLRKHQRYATVALVGHEPLLGELTGALITGSPNSFIALKKGGVVIVRFIDRIASGRALLEGVFPPTVLRALQKETSSLT